MGTPTRLRFVWGLIVMWALILATACGTTSSSGTDGASVGEEEPPVGDEPNDIVPVGDGLALRVTGVVDDAGLLCPGGQRPCLAVEPPIELEDDGDEPVRVTGRLAEGLLTVTDREPPPENPFDLSDRCEGKVPSLGVDEELRAALSGSEEGADVAPDSPVADYRRSIDDDVAILWNSPTGVLHLGVVGPAGPHDEALAELGVGEKVCVVGGFAHSERELRRLQDQVRPVVDRWVEDELNESFSWNADPFNGTVTIDIFQIDAAMVAELREATEGALTVHAAIEVLDGTLADLDAALAEVQADGSTPEITMTCGAVVFASIPADVDGFPPLDDETQAALDAVATGPLGVEAAYYVDNYRWSLASRTAEEMVLFGQAVPGGRADPGDGTISYADMRLTRSGGEWAAGGFGDCRLEVSALGLGPAELALDPDRAPDPASTELALVINERACANGEAPIDREVVPVVTETDTAVEIVVLVAPVKGDATCPGNPWHPITVALDAPLGERTVFDGSTQPPTPRSWPPAAELLDG